MPTGKQERKEQEYNSFETGQADIVVLKGIFVIHGELFPGFVLGQSKLNNVIGCSAILKCKINNLTLYE